MKTTRMVGYAPMSMDVECVDLPDEPPPGKMLVECRTNAISAGTEIACYQGNTTYRSKTHPPDWRVDPYFPGYSIAGVVRAVGSDVTEFVPGERVCGMGPHASAVIVDPDSFVPIPNNVSYDNAALTTLICIAMNGVRLANIQLGDRVVVAGCGIVGQLAIQLCKIAGARPVVAVDPIGARTDIAVRCGATAGLDPTDPEFFGKLTEITVDKGIDVVFETTGSVQAFNPTLKLVKTGGRCILLGCTRGVVDGLDPYADIHLKGVSVIGAHMFTHPACETPHNPWTWQNNRILALQLISDGSLILEPLISHRVPGEMGPAMFGRLANMRETFMGVLLQWEQ
jgi:L-iditol 2-dehydrogenase